jgi:hypothetical protein
MEIYHLATLAQLMQAVETIQIVINLERERLYAQQSKQLDK